MRVVARGAFMVEVLRHDGRRLVLDILGPGDGVGGPGDAIGADPLAGARVAQATARALGPGRLRSLQPGEEVSLLVRRAERAARLAADLAWFDVPTRLLTRLGNLADRFGHAVPGGGAAIGLRLRHDDLAALCGTSRESVTRAMSVLVADGRVWVPRRGRIVVRRPAGGVAPAPPGPAAARARIVDQEPLPSWSRMRLHEPQ
jgi:CRP-like cAMP-binding protein